MSLLTLLLLSSVCGIFLCLLLFAFISMDERCVKIATTWRTIILFSFCVKISNETATVNVLAAKMCNYTIWSNAEQMSRYCISSSSSSPPTTTKLTTELSRTQINTRQFALPCSRLVAFDREGEFADLRRMSFVLSQLFIGDFRPHHYRWRCCYRTLSIWIDSRQCRRHSPLIGKQRWGEAIDK